MNPSGAANVLIETTAVIILGRSATGVRDVSTAKNGPLMSGVKNMPTKSATVTTGHGGMNGNTQIGTTKRRIETPASRNGATFRTTTIAATLPTTAPAPRAA